jgi:hypothetical protein
MERRRDRIQARQIIDSGYAESMNGDVLEGTAARPEKVREAETSYYETNDS